ncbi:MAG: hypothetical protein J6J31_05260 [Thermoguttaceae bacterium]|nr:hypothetical protein [Thermoguttaceae bacterium]
MFRVTDRRIEIGPGVFMEYRVVILFWLFHLPGPVSYFEEDGSHIYPLRPTDVSRLSPKAQRPFLDRFGWLLIFAVMLGIGVCLQIVPSEISIP